MGKVTGIGGIFFKCRDPKAITAWYADNLGLDTNEYGCTFEWRDMGTGQTGCTQWSPFSQASGYFDPSPREFMINYRVEDIEALVGTLKKNGVPVLDEITTHEYGKFVHILDPENNKIELWEPAP